MPAKEMIASPSPRVVPANRFVGKVEVDRMEAQITSIACHRTGDIVLLTMNGPRTTVSAIAATLHKGGKSRKPVHFTAEQSERWHGPDQLYRMEGLGSGWIVSKVEPTTQLDVAVLAHAANIAYCCQNPIPQPQKMEAPPPLRQESDTRRKPPSLPTLPIPPLRFLLANEGAEHPDWTTFTGLMRTLWLPFSLPFAPLMWEAGLRTPLQLAEDESTQLEGEHILIEPVECTCGIAAWQIIPTKQWGVLLEQVTLQGVSSGL